MLQKGTITIYMEGLIALERHVDSANRRLGLVVPVAATAIVVVIAVRHGVEKLLLEQRS